MRELAATNVSLLGRLRSGDPAAWSEFDCFHRGLILYWARSFGCAADEAEDVCQETMVSLFRALPSFEHDERTGGFHAFLKTLVRRRVPRAAMARGWLLTARSRWCRCATLMQLLLAVEKRTFCLTPPVFPGATAGLG